MKPRLYGLLMVAVISAIMALCARSVGAAEAGAEAGDDAGLDAGADVGPDGSSSPAVPIACDASLCDTTNGSACGVCTRRLVVDATARRVLLGFSLIALALIRRRSSTGSQR